MNEIIPLPLAIFPAEVLQRLGYSPNQAVMKKVRDLLMASMDLARELAHPQAILCTYPLKHDALSFSLQDIGLTVRIPELVEWSQNCTQASVFAVSLGTELCDQVRTYGAEGNVSQAEVLAEVGIDALLQAAHLLHEKLIMQGIQSGFQITHPVFAPETADGDALYTQLLRVTDAAAVFGFSEGHSDCLNMQNILCGLIGWIPFSD